MIDPDQPEEEELATEELSPEERERGWAVRPTPSGKFAILYTTTVGLPGTRKGVYHCHLDNDPEELANLIAILQQYRGVLLEGQ
jgi:hypothetical protein